MAYIFAGNLIDRISNIEIESSQYMYFLMPIIGMILSHLLYKQRIAHIVESQPEEQKFAEYQTACLIRWAVLEGFTFIILFAMPEALLAGVPLIFYMISLMPTEEQFREIIGRSG